jgi:hypothetical protein
MPVHVQEQLFRAIDRDHMLARLMTENGRRPLSVTESCELAGLVDGEEALTAAANAVTVRDAFTLLQAIRQSPAAMVAAAGEREATLARIRPGAKARPKPVLKRIADAVMVRRPSVPSPDRQVEAFDRELERLLGGDGA